MGVFAIVGLAGILVSVILAMAPHGGAGRFYFAWLTAWASALAIALGALFFVLIQHLTAAGWSVTVRRLAEALSVTLPVLGVLSLPILVSVLSQKGDLYRWALPLPDHAAMKAEHGAHTAEAGRAEGHGSKVLDELTLKKRAWLNPTFFTVRVLFYFVVWSAIALYFWRASVRQDESGDPAISHRLRLVSAPALVVYGLTVTGAAFDLLMSLDPHWYSTIFGVYYFSGGVVAFFAMQIVLCSILQRHGLLQRSINIEHYHDLGVHRLQPVHAALVRQHSRNHALVRPARGDVGHHGCFQVGLCHQWLELAGRWGAAGPSADSVCRVAVAPCEAQPPGGDVLGRVAADVPLSGDLLGGHAGIRARCVDVFPSGYHRCDGSHRCGRDIHRGVALYGEPCGPSSTGRSQARRGSGLREHLMR
jgi:hypothetical protein